MALTPLLRSRDASRKSAVRWGKLVTLVGRSELARTGSNGDKPIFGHFGAGFLEN